MLSDGFDAISTLPIGTTLKTTRPSRQVHVGDALHIRLRDGQHLVIFRLERRRVVLVPRPSESLMDLPRFDSRPFRPKSSSSPAVARWISSRGRTLGLQRVEDCVGRGFEVGERDTGPWRDRQSLHSPALSSES